MTRLRPALLVLAAVLASSLAPPAPGLAQVEVDINQGQVQAAQPIAVAALSGPQGPELARVLSADLERSGLFRLLPQSAFPEASPDVEVQPRLEAWRAAGAQALVNGRATVDADGKLRVDFRLWDTGSGRQLAGAQFTSTPENWRRMAHKVADAVYKRTTGEDGYFDTRVVFVAESGDPSGRRVKRLAVMDQDGANPVFLTNGPEQVLTPRFSASGREIAYMSLRADSARVQLFDVETARRESLGDFPGYAYAPRFSPDGAKVAFALNAGGGASQITVVDLRTRAVSRLTSDGAVNTSPAYSPDGSRLVFNSDRGGSPQLYVMAAAGGPSRRISFGGGGRYTAPTWSPKGDLIAFVRQDGGRFHIGVMRPDGSGERLLTASYLDEAPTFAPNGRVLMYAHQATSGAPSRLWMVDVDGRGRRPVPYTGAASDPSWSPLLK